MTVLRHNFVGTHDEGSEVYVKAMPLDSDRPSLQNCHTQNASVHPDSV